MSEHPRGELASSRLVRLGFRDPDGTEQALVRLGLLEDPQIEPAVADAADPDLAVRALERLLDAADDRDALLAALHTDPALRARLVAVLGASATLGDHLARHPGDWRALAVPDSPTEGATGFTAGQLTATVQEAVAPYGASSAAVDALRVAYRRQLLGVAARDLTGSLSLEQVGRVLADLAGAALEVALSIARAQLPAGGAPCRLAVIGMGKCGGAELNYVSDVDVIFLAAPDSPPGDAGAAAGADSEAAALRTAEQLAAAMMRICSATTAEGTLWPVDAGLRPEGRAGPLVRTLASHEAYYLRWAKTWEFQALLKARPIAGDRQRFDDRPDGLGRRRPTRLRAGRAGDAAAGGRHAARRRGRPRAQTRPGWPAGCRVRRPAPPVGARSQRSHSARRRHIGRAAGALGGRLRR